MANNIYPLHVHWQSMLDNKISLGLYWSPSWSAILKFNQEQKTNNANCAVQRLIDGESELLPYLLLGFRSVALDGLPCHQSLQSVLDSAYLVWLDVQLQGEERLQSGRLFRVLLIHHRSEHKKKQHPVRNDKDNKTLFLFFYLLFLGCCVWNIWLNRFREQWCYSFRQ